jgi:hypothetical protein
VGGSPYDITATLADPDSKLGNYDVTLNKGKLTVNPAPLTVKANNKNKLYGAAVPPLDGTITGIKNGDAITASYLAGAGGSVNESSNVGLYDIIPVLHDPTTKLPNYAVSPINGTLTINKAPLTMIADPKTMFFGASAPPAFTVTFGGFVLGQSVSSLTGTPTFTGAATTANASTPVGSYTIIPGGLSSANYDISPVNGTLKVIYNNVVGRQFLQPVNIPPQQRSAFKIGSTIPVKFELYLADGVTRVTNATATIELRKISNSTPAADAEAVYTNVPDQGISFRYTGGQYIFNLGTKNVQQTAGTYQLTAFLNDGTSIMQEIEMRTN